MEYPEEIYRTLDGGTLPDYQRDWGREGEGRRHAYRVGYGKGMTRGIISQLSQPDPLAGYSNLTAAISAGEPIDWERLDGLKVQCVHPEVGELRGVLKRDAEYPIESSDGWWTGDISLYIRALDVAWLGIHGWSLWVEGEVPLRRKTADQLEVGTYFLGKAWGDVPHLAYVGRPLKTDAVKTIYYAPDMLKAITPASEWEVIEECGTFQKPEGK